MCRIAGIVDALRYHDQLREDVNAMIDQMIYGGPDGRGIYCDKTLAFGHCRLSLLDLSDAAAQPMQFEELVISYNGEIYNFQEIKNELINKSHLFLTNSDTEVILHAYEEWGVNAFSKFNGMFAFALYDKSEQNVYLVRDPNGIKPLYYYCDNKQLIFSSETKVFKSFIDDENQNWQTLFLAYGHLPEPYTKYKNVYALPKSSYLKFSLRNSTFNIHKFEYASSNSLKQVGIADLAYSLQQSVKRHLISDAAIGVFLSGGIDSSIITLLASEFTEQLHTLSIYFNEGEYSEKYYQDIIVKKINSNHHALLLKDIDFEKHYQEILLAYDSPSNDGVNTWFISKFARENKLKAVLSGLGADELFGGYPSFKRLSQLKKLHQYKNLINPFSNFLSGNYNRLAFLKLEENISDYLLLRGFYSPKKISSILGISENEVMQTLNSNTPNTARKLNTLKDVSDMEREMYMQNQLLKDSDTMSMRHGIEIRVPFLDNEFLFVLNKLNEDDRFPTPGKKEVLIDLFENILPKEIYDRPKKGFQFPFKIWLKEMDGFNEKFNKHSFREEFLSFKKDKTHWSKIWALAQL